MGELRALGVKLSVDDFGTGYSSLTYLKGLPVDEVKIDKGFVDGLAHDPADRAVVRAVVDIAHTLGLRVVAEGVEQRGPAGASCASLGVDEVQGYLHARPMPASRRRRLAAEHARRQRPLTPAKHVPGAGTGCSTTQSQPLDVRSAAPRTSRSSAHGSPPTGDRMSSSVRTARSARLHGRAFGLRHLTGLSGVCRACGHRPLRLPTDDCYAGAMPGHGHRPVMATRSSPVRCHQDGRSRAVRRHIAGGRLVRALSGQPGDRLARAKTSSSIGSVSRPVKVFCWLTWKQPSTVGPPSQRDLRAVPERRHAGGHRVAGRPQHRPQRRPAEAAEHHDGPHRRQQEAPLRGQPGRAGVALRGRRLVGRRGAPHRQRDRGCRAAPARRRAEVDVGWLASPARCSAANSQSPLRSPVKMRPVRLPPCAAGASPTTTMRGVGRPPAGDRPAPVVLGRRTTRA